MSRFSILYILLHTHFQHILGSSSQLSLTDSCFYLVCFQTCFFYWQPFYVWYVYSHAYSHLCVWYVSADECMLVCKPVADVRILPQSLPSSLRWSLSNSKLADVVCLAGQLAPGILSLPFSARIADRSPCLVLVYMHVGDLNSLLQACTASA